MNDKNIKNGGNIRKANIPTMNFAARCVISRVVCIMPAISSAHVQGFLRFSTRRREKLFLHFRTAIAWSPVELQKKTKERKKKEKYERFCGAILIITTSFV